MCIGKKTMKDSKVVKFAIVGAKIIAPIPRKFPNCLIVFRGALMMRRTLWEPITASTP
jgi:hypothetical protein